MGWRWHWQLNQEGVLRVVKSTRLRLTREIYIGDRPYIQNGAEQCELREWSSRETGSVVTVVLKPV
jgi:hypothetical protein